MQIVGLQKVPDTWVVACLLFPQSGIEHRVTRRVSLNHIFCCNQFGLQPTSWAKFPKLIATEYRTQADGSPCRIDHEMAEFQDFNPLISKEATFLRDHQIQATFPFVSFIPRPLLERNRDAAPPPPGAGGLDESEHGWHSRTRVGDQPLGGFFHSSHRLRIPNPNSGMQHVINILRLSQWLDLEVLLLGMVKCVLLLCLYALTKGEMVQYKQK